MTVPYLWRKTVFLEHCRRKAIHSAALLPPPLPRYLKMLLLRNGGQEDKDAARMVWNESETHAFCQSLRPDVFAIKS